MPMSAPLHGKLCGTDDRSIAHTRTYTCALCCLSIMGQPAHRASKPDQELAPFRGKDCFRKVPCPQHYFYSGEMGCRTCCWKLVLCVFASEAWKKIFRLMYEWVRRFCFNPPHMTTKVLTVRGRSGCMLVMAPIEGEGGGLIADRLRSLPAGGLQQTVAVSTDDPRLLSALQNVLPNLRPLCLDPVHLWMSFEYGTFRKRTLASRTLRLMMNKFNAADRKANCTSPVFTGVDAPVLNHVTKSRREQILSGGMAKATAERISSNLEGDAPWTSESEFVEALGRPCAHFSWWGR